MNRNIILFSAPGLFIAIVNLSIFWGNVSPKWPLISWAILCAIRGNRQGSYRYEG